MKNYILGPPHHSVTLNNWPLHVSLVQLLLWSGPVRWLCFVFNPLNPINEGNLYELIHKGTQFPILSFPSVIHDDHEWEVTLGRIVDVG